MHYIYCMRRDPQSFPHMCGLLLGAKAPRIVWWYATSMIRLDFQNWVGVLCTRRLVFQRTQEMEKRS